MNVLHRDNPRHWVLVVAFYSAGAAAAGPAAAAHGGAAAVAGIEQTETADQAEPGRIAGTVLDAGSGEPLAGTLVRLVEIDRREPWVAAGSETDHLHVHFLDEEGSEVDPGDDHYLEGAVADEAIAEIEQHTPGEFEIHVVGVAPGETTLQLEWMHGAVGSGHAHYTSPEIPVTVTP